MDNVIELFVSRNTEVKDSTHQFVYDYLIPWAETHRIDTDSKLFKLNAATIMSCLQGMLVDVQ